MKGCGAKHLCYWPILLRGSWPSEFKMLSSFGPGKSLYFLVSLVQHLEQLLFSLLLCYVVKSSWFYKWLFPACFRVYFISIIYLDTKRFWFKRCLSRSPTVNSAAAALAPWFPTWGEAIITSLYVEEMLNHKRTCLLRSLKRVGMFCFTSWPWVLIPITYIFFQKSRNQGKMADWCRKHASWQQINESSQSAVWSSLMENSSLIGVGESWPSTACIQYIYTVRV